MTPREIRFGLDGLTGVAIVSVAAALASLTWTLAGYASGASPVAAAVEAYVPPSPAPDITALVNLPPFGKAVIGPATVAASGNLTLHGVLLANPATQSSVLIAVTGQDAVSYRIGEVIPGGGTIDSIGVDYVTLRNGAQYMTLYFPDDPRAAGAPGAPAVPNAAPRGDLPPQPGEAPPPGAAPPPPSSGVEAMRALLPPSVVPRAPPREVAPPPPPPPPTGQNVGSGNGLIDRPGVAGTPRQ